MIHYVIGTSGYVLMLGLMLGYVTGKVPISDDYFLPVMWGVIVLTVLVQVVVWKMSNRKRQLPPK